MYPHQAERLRAALDAHGLDALVASSPENVRYLTGFVSLTHAVHRTPQFAVHGRGGTALVVPAIDVAPVVADRIEVDRVTCFGAPGVQLTDAPGTEARRVREIVGRRAASPADALALALDALGVAGGTVGVDESRIAPEAWRRLAERLAPRRVAPAAEPLAAARRVKGPYEIECLQRALGIAEEALDEVVQALRAGTTEREAAALFDAGVARRGATPRPGVVALGASTSIPAPWPGDRALRPGDLVRCDVGCASRGYRATVARTAVLGAPSARQDAVYGALLSGLAAALDAIAPGVSAGAVFDRAVSTVRAAGLLGYEPDRVGHGIGLEPREPPDLARGVATPLEVGEVLRVELVWIEPGWAGLGVAETVLVGRSGARVMNRSARGLVVLD